MSRMSSSWAVMKASATVLWLDKELLVFPLLSGGGAVMITATFVAPIVFFGGPEALGALDDPRYVMYSGGFLYYLVLYTAVFFFNTGLVGAALIRLDGGDPTVPHRHQEAAHHHGLRSHSRDIGHRPARHRGARGRAGPHRGGTHRGILDSGHLYDGARAGDPRCRPDRCRQGERERLQEDLGRAGRG